MDRFIILGVFAVAALLARTGLALYATGLSRSKNSAGAVMRLVCDLCTATLAFVLVGAAVQFNVGNPYFPVDFTLPPGGHDSHWPVFFFAVVTLVATGAVSGAVAERSTFFPLCAASALLAGLVVPAGANWVQRGWLSRRNFIDVGGSAWLHLAGGMCAAVAAYLVGPRQGKYHRDGSSSVIPGHSVPLAAVGVLVMLAGWVAYVAGCQYRHGGADSNGASLAALNVLVAGAAGGLASLLYGQVRYGKPDVLLTLTGLLGALVAGAAGGAVVDPLWAGVTGAVAGILVPAAAIWIDVFLRIDDPVSAVAVHAVGGAWGTLAAGAFAPGTIGERLRQLGVQAVGLLAIAALSGLLSAGLFAALKATVGLRAKEADEFDGLDLAEHDIAAYPDFQHNSIRSYHLREA